MTDPIRTPAEALEVAAREAQLLPSGPWATEAEAMAAVTHAAKIAAHIRALASRIPPEPDDEALERMLLTALSQSVAWEEGDGEGAVRDILVALREAGARR